jgi:hypothetical protein
MEWTKDKLELVKVYLTQGYSYREIAKKMSLKYDQVRDAIRRYRLKTDVDLNLLFTKDKNKLKKDDVTRLAHIIGEKLYENYKKVKLVEPKAISSRGKGEETSILDLSDIHIGMSNEVFDSSTGKRTITYNMDIFKQELNNLQQSIGEIYGILKNSYKLKKLVINLLGDIITNDRIFPEQSFEIEKVAGLQVFDAVTYLSLFINNLLKYYEKIEVVGVVGNHGRSNPTHYNEPPQNNFEYFLYKMLQKQFEKSKRVTVIVPETRRYIHEICGWRHLLEHGDSFRGSTETYIKKQVEKLYLNIGGFDVIHYGHFHKLKDDEMADKVIIKQNGSWILKDNYAFKKYKTYSVPKQFFFGCNKKRPETWSYKIDLRG